jgi:predicted kinase
VDLVLIHGLPAAGKLTTARQLSELVGVPVFFNHLTVPRY